MSEINQYESIQPDDKAGDLETAIQGLVREQQQRERQEADLETEGYARKLLNLARKRIGTGDDDVASMLLGEARDVLESDEDFPGLLRNAEQLIEHPNLDLSQREARKVVARYKRQRRMRRQGRLPDPSTEVVTVDRLAMGLKYLWSVGDMTNYAPVTLDDVAALPKNPDEPQIVGRRRLKVESAASPEDRAVRIPHSSCDHILGIALPRRGKDSTITSIGKSLHEDYGYKYISIMDDGRMETPMLAIPNDEPAIQDSLEEIDQEPDAFAAEVYTPAMNGLPERLPANFVPFTIGIDSLTPQLILRLADVTGSDATVEQRVQKALDEAIEHGSGTVNELISYLKIYAKEGLEITLEWGELGDAAEDGGVVEEEYSTSYETSAEDAMKTAARRLAHLAEKGLIAGVGATTNLDMKEVVRDHETAAVLCCNFLPEAQEGLKYTIMDLWLRLVFRARDRHPRLPRVCLEIRELKNVAPTNKVLGERHKKAIKTLRQTIFEISTQGGSRRIMMLASTQKLNDVLKAIRSNMATKILLNLGEEEIQTLDKAYNFSYEQQKQIKEFEVGDGMVIAEGDKYWPIFFRGCPAGLGFGDRHWRDRYAEAYGARVREDDGTGWYPRGADDPGRPDWWANANTGEVNDTETVGPPAVGEWYLLPQDLEEHLPGGDLAGEQASADNPTAVTDGGIAAETLEAALAARRPYPLKVDIGLEPVQVARSGGRMHYSTDTLDSEVQKLIDEFDIPKKLRPWLSKEPDLVRKLGQVVDTVAEYECTSQQDIVDNLPGDSLTRSTLGNHFGKEGTLNALIKKVDGTYRLTKLGGQAAQVDWIEVSKRLKDGRRNV